MTDHRTNLKTTVHKTTKWGNICLGTGIPGITTYGDLLSMTIGDETIPSQTMKEEGMTADGRGVGVNAPGSEAIKKL
jgi:hypothetical protein